MAGWWSARVLLTSPPPLQILNPDSSGFRMTKCGSGRMGCAVPIVGIAGPPEGVPQISFLPLTEGKGVRGTVVPMCRDSKFCWMGQTPGVTTRKLIE